MGEIAHVDLDRLRGLAESFWHAADDVAAMQWPPPVADELPGSTVAALRIADLIADQISDLVAGLNGWAMAARTSAEAFQHADAANGERFALR